MRKSALHPWIAVILTFVLAGCAATASTDGSDANSYIQAAQSSTPELTEISTPTQTVSPTATQTTLAADLPMDEVSYLIPPTIRYLSSGSVTIFFELDQPDAGTVYLLNENREVVQEAAWEGEDARQMISFEGLAGGTTYQLIPVLTRRAEPRQPNYQGTPWALSCTTIRENKPLRVGVISDASFGDEVSQQIIEEMAAADLDFVLHLGDVVDETDSGIDPFESYAVNYYLPFASLLQQMPVYTVPGNHDYDADIRYTGEPFYFHAFPAAPQVEDRQYYAIDFGDLRFVMLDAMTLWGMPGKEEQNEWLAKQLQEEGVAFIPVFHIAPYSSSSVHIEDNVPIQTNWVPLFEGANVPLVLSGHYHHYERLIVNGITYIVDGGGSEVTYALGQYMPGTVVAKRVSSFVILEIWEGEISIIANDKTGTMIDEVVIYY